MGFGPGRTLTVFVLANGGLAAVVIVIVVLKGRANRRVLAA
jgi:hypothetical protein